MLLKTPPENVSPAALMTWKAIEPLNLRKFKLLSPAFAPIPFKNTVYKEWVEGEWSY